MAELNRYRYVDEGRTHVHQLWSVLPETGEEAWQPLIGTSTVAKESVNKGDGLMMWYADLAALDALGRAMPVETYKNLLVDYDIAELIQDWKEKSAAKKKLDVKYPDFAESRKAAIRKRDGSAKTGTERHTTLEDYVKGCISENGGKPRQMADSGEIQAFVDWCVEHVDHFVFTEGHCFSEKLWLGGIADIGMILKNDGEVLCKVNGVTTLRVGQRLIGDHKSSKNAFFDQFIQGTLYDMQLAENGILDRNGNKIGDWALADGIVIFPFRSDPFTPEFRWNIGEYRSVAEGVVRTYKLKEYNHV